MADGMLTTPALRVSAKFGSKAAVGLIVGVSRAAVSQWDTIPARHHGALLREATRRGISLQPWEFSMLPEEALSLGLISDLPREAA